MSKSHLDREYGVLLTVGGPELLKRVDYYRRIAQILREDGSKNTADYVDMQADRLEETIRMLGRASEQTR